MAGTLSVDTIKSGSASTPPTFQDSAGTQVGTLCRAWVNFNGTGTVAIRASFNVTSITDNGIGDYTVNFTNALADANYSVVASIDTVGVSNTPAWFNTQNGSTYSTTAVRGITTNNGTTFTDIAKINLAIFR
jgi:hypothetical protein